MHGSPLTSSECVNTMLSYFDRKIASGVERTHAIAVTAEHFHVDCFKVEHFVDERRDADLRRRIHRNMDEDRAILQRLA